MANDTITAEGYPTCGCCGGKNPYKPVKRTYKNYCPNCKRTGTLVAGTLGNSVKGVVDGEITCGNTGPAVKSKGNIKGCDADYCVFCGGDKAGHGKCKTVKLTPASESTEDENTETESSSSYDEMIKNLLKPLDGEVEYKIRENRVYINKIPTPEESCKLWIREGVNITSDGVTISDYNPDTPNFFLISYGENYDKQFVIKIPKLIGRFGVKIKEINAVKKVLKWTLEETSTTEDTTSTSEDSTE